MSLSECEPEVTGGPCSSETPESSMLEEGFGSMVDARGVTGQSGFEEVDGIVDWTVRGWRAPSGRVVHTNWVCSALQSGSGSIAVRLCGRFFPEGSNWPHEQFRRAAFEHGDVAHVYPDGCELSSGSGFRLCRVCAT